mmetsp:Transcript_76633/g.224940  ORF Transcript_76633/g.224940 Transcript_76633/m.224940 type:complete len:257 (-) Transcript_76633:462-1232(-)
MLSDETRPSTHCADEASSSQEAPGASSATKRSEVPWPSRAGSWSVHGDFMLAWPTSMQGAVLPPSSAAIPSSVVLSLAAAGALTPALSWPGLVASGIPAWSHCPKPPECSSASSQCWMALIAACGRSSEPPESTASASPSSPNKPDTPETWPDSDTEAPAARPRAFPLHAEACACAVAVSPPAGTWLQDACAPLFMSPARKLKASLFCWTGAEVIGTEAMNESMPLSSKIAPLPSNNEQTSWETGCAAASAESRLS